jgi:hypothetical protein
MLMPLYGAPLCRSGRVMRPAACSALQGFTHGRTPFSRALTMLDVMRV